MRSPRRRATPRSAAGTPYPWPAGHGRNVLENFFPGISETLLGAGAIHADVVRDFRWFMEGACLSRPDSCLNVLLLTHPMLEAAVRSAERPNSRRRRDRRSVSRRPYRR